MEEIIKKLDASEVKLLLELMKLSKGDGSNVSQSVSQPVRLAPPLVEIKLDGPTTYLSWSRWVQGALARRNMEGYLTREKVEPKKNSIEWNEWKTTHILLYTWIINPMVPSIAVTVDGIQSVKDIWIKLRRTYVGLENSMRVFQIEQEIEGVVQRDKSVQEFATELEKLWAEYDYFSPTTSCKDLDCKSREREAQKRTMLFLRKLNPKFEQRRGVLLSQAKIPVLEEAIAAMIQEETRIGLASESSSSSSMRSALSVSTPGHSRQYEETRRCYNYGEVWHISRTCPKPPKDREGGGRGQFGGRGHGGRRGGRGGYRANLMVVEDEGEFNAEEGYETKQKSESVMASTSSGSFATYAHSSQGDVPGEEDWPDTWNWNVA